MSAKDLTEWEEYDRLEPFGQRRGDMQAGIVASALMRAFVGADRDPRSYSIEALIERELGPVDEVDAAQMAERQLEAFKQIAARSEAERQRKEKGDPQKPERVLVPRGKEPPGRTRRGPRRRGK